MNLFGPTRVASLDGMHYIFVLVDDYSIFTWVCFLAYKNDAFDAFKALQKEFKKKKVFTLLALEVIMESNLKMNFSTPFTMNMVFLITILPLAHLNKIG